jgi:HD-GYP domain-containing protein (c-di-GMP phosphodiesterase class II)
MALLRKELVECKIGEVIGEDVIDIRTGTILCNKGHIITGESLGWLDKFICSDIYIQIEEEAPQNISWNRVWNVDEKSTKVYTQNTKKLQNVFEQVKNNGNIKKQEVEEVRETFFQELNTNHNIMGCVNKVKTIDEYTYIHSMNVGMLSVLIGKWMKLDEKTLEKLFLTGILHDLGKYKVDLEVLNKRGRLTPKEYELVRAHVQYSYEMVKEMEGIDDEIIRGVHEHHERIDGSGYPQGLKGDEISLFGKILSIADTYDAMISERVYKAKHTPFFVMETLIKEGIDKLDTSILLTFLKNIAEYYVGVQVKLNDGRAGEVVFIHPHSIHTPIVKVGDEYIDLEKNRDIIILDIL